MSEPNITPAEIRAVADILSVCCSRCGSPSMLRFDLSRTEIERISKREAGYRLRNWENGADVYLAAVVDQAAGWPGGGLPCPSCGLVLRLVADPPPPHPPSCLQPVEDWEEQVRRQWAVPVPPEHQAEADRIARSMRWTIALAAERSKAAG